MNLHEKAEIFLKELLSTELKKPAAQISSDSPFDALGVDSLIIMRINKSLEKQFGRLPKTLFYEYATIRELAGYFIQDHHEMVKNLIPQETLPPMSQKPPVAQKTEKHKTPANSNYRQIGNILNPIRETVNKFTQGPKPAMPGRLDEDIAIIGISGRYPQADDIEEFWNILMDGRDCITEIPQDRWNLFQSLTNCRSRWGGFINNVDKFDPLFFNISPRDAEMMDPQQRLFMEVCWKALEDAGYSLQAFLKKTHESVGVFAGSSWTEYELLANSSSQYCPDVHPGSIATRVSYHFGFHGPSIALDTHCSSALTAVHMACESIRRGECRAAFAGGVNLSLHPNKYKQMNAFLSTDGKCRSFGEGGNGYVPGEGVGVVILKPLAEAVQDGDIIYAVIKSGAVNHGGKTNGYSVPNPNAQCDVVRTALERAGIDARSISFIEAHGTGTELGDPVEITGLTKAFEAYTQDRQFCSIGSVKSNIGHAEGAAGIAQITRVVLQMKHKMLVPSLHCDKTNPNIAFEETPFYVQRELAEWKQPEVFIDREEKRFPRRAGISSFGAGGTNTHLILEEYEVSGQQPEDDNKTHIVVLSAKNEERLVRYALDLLEWLKRNRTQPPSLASLAYTLQAGRQAMDERLAAVVSSIEELMEQLDGFVRQNANKVQRGKVDRANKNIQALIEGEEGNEFLKILVERRKLDKLASLWVMGVDIEWDLIYTRLPRRISLPTYPFERVRCWIQEENQTAPVVSVNDHLILNKDWRQAPLEAQQAPHLRGKLVILANHDTRPLAGVISRLPGLNEAIIIYDASEKHEDGISENGFAFHSAAQGVEIANRVMEKFGEIAGVIDLSDVYIDCPKQRTGMMGRITLLQELIKNVVNPGFIVFHLTSGLQAFMSTQPTLSGADLCGLVKMLGNEYKKVVSKTVDIDIPLSSEQEIADLIYREMYAKSPEVCYRNGIRYLPCFKEIFSGQGRENEVASGFYINPQRVVVITGGTRGIGAEIARHIVRKGVRKLVIMGASGFPDRKDWDGLLGSGSKDSEVCTKISNILELESKGVAVDIYTGRLTDRSKLEAFFTRIRSERGEIGGVIHCAGLLQKNSPVFINKKPEEVKMTYEPKVEGLEVLHDILGNDRLDFFILFSSVSALIPPLATGGSDYAAANDFMNHFAQYQFLKGKTFYKSIVWPSWKGTGMGEIKSPVYTDMGFKAHFIKEGIFLFDKAFDFKHNPCILPCVVNPSIFHAEELLEGKQRNKPTIQTGTPQMGAMQLTPDESGTGAISWLRDLFSRELKIPQNQLKDHTPFEEYGVDSIVIALLVQKMEEQIGKSLDPSIILEYPTLKSLAAYMDEMDIQKPWLSDEAQRYAAGSSQTNSRVLPCSMDKQDAHSDYKNEVNAKPKKVAVIGMACNFPGSPDIESFWENLANGVDCIREVPKSRFDVDKYYHPEYRKNGIISRYGGFIDRIEDFDAHYFNISEEDAPHIDPLMRQFMEISVQAVRNAGYEKHELSGKKAGVFAGTRISNFAERIQDIHKNTVMGVGQNFIASHVSHFFNLKGPSMVVDTACSSSLASLHLACQSLFSGESNMALAGGVDILMDEKSYMLLSEARALSPDGKCYTFDEKANGFVPGEGCGVVMLKLLERALEDGDRILAVIDGSALNNDGHTMGITTPNPEAQREVIEEALNRAKVDPASISYMEAHGTGTQIGDPIELKALTTVFRRYTDEKQFCAIGSVKTNHGHLLSAAGISGFIKVVLSIMNKQIPPTLNCMNPNPRFEFETSPFYINRVLTRWEPLDGIRRAGISSFGFGGTNAHIIVSECKQELSEGARTVRKPLTPVEFKKKRYWIDTFKQDGQAGTQSGIPAAHEAGTTRVPLLEINFE